MRIRFDTKKPVVLAIDDIDVNLHMIENVLGKGVQVIKRDSGRGGLDYMDGNHVDIVLLDCNMPGMSGIDVLDVMKRQEKTRTLP
ncbi:MAG: response regulator, partial [Selenomonadaceae bacterium]|nr:response regulator [Selenomonadaceae bacterium]